MKSTRCQLMTVLLLAGLLLFSMQTAGFAAKAPAPGASSTAYRSRPDHDQCRSKSAPMPMMPSEPP